MIRPLLLGCSVIILVACAMQRKIKKANTIKEITNNSAAASTQLNKWQIEEQKAWQDTKEWIWIKPQGNFRWGKDGFEGQAKEIYWYQHGQQLAHKLKRDSMAQTHHLSTKMQQEKQVEATVKQQWRLSWWHVFVVLFLASATYLCYRMVKRRFFTML
ncbi:hypothetical protein [Pedobacter sp. UBA4863]|uniref:hypothetical protein n=1 Tax=Pedobacter sp. UBA4863 TaxID=1947060 RepID=UPI0025DC1DCB|nr:hypothetical protein [Pedobacter sp. UBA4863]